MNTSSSALAETLRSLPPPLCQKLLSRLAAVSFELSPDGTARYVSQNLGAVTGYAPGDVLGRNWWELFCRGEQTAQVTPLVNHLTAGDVAGYPLTVTTRAGDHLTWEIDTANRYGPAGELLAIVGYAVSRAAPSLAVDKTVASSQAVEGQPEPTAGFPIVVEESSSFIEQLFRLSLQNVPVSVAAQDKDLRFIWAYNQRTVKPSTVIGKTDAEVFPPDSAARLVALKRQVLETGTALREPFWMTSGGRSVFIDLYLEPLRDAAGQIAGVGIATVDLTQQKRAEEALRESERRYRTLFETMHEGFALCEIVTDECGNPSDYRCLEINPPFEALIGLRAADVLGRTVSQFLPESQRSLLQLFHQAAVSGRPVQFEREAPVTGRTLSATVYSPQPGQIILFFTDVTARKANDARIRFQANLLDVVEQAVIATDTADRIVYWNSFAERLYGWPAAEALGQDPLDLIASHRSPEEQATLRAHLQGPVSQTGEFYLERRDGSLFPAQVTHSPVYDDEGSLTGHVGVSMDIIDQQRALAAREQYLARLGKLIRVSQRILAASSVADLLQSAADGARDLTEAQICVAGHGWREGRFQRGAASYLSGTPGPLTADPQVLDPAVPYLITAQTTQPFRFSTDQVRDLLENRRMPAAHRPIRNLMGAPLMGQDGTVWGRIMVADRLEGEFSVEDEALLTQLASMASLALNHLEARQAAEQKAAESNTVFNALADAVMVYNDHYQLVQANPAARAAFGYDPAAPLPQQWPAGADLKYPDRRPVPPDQRPWRRALRGETVLHERYVFTNTGRPDLNVLISAAPLGTATQPRGSVATWHDVTERDRLLVQLEAARDELEQRVRERTRAVDQANAELRAEIAERLAVEKQLQLQTTALQAAANGIVITDRQGNIQWVNPAFTELTGFTAEECLGFSLRFLRSGEHTPVYYEDMWQTILAGRVWHGETINRHRSGRLYTEEQTITPVADADGQVSHFIAIKQDITDRKHTEQALLRANALLERVFDSIDLLIAYLDRDLNFLRVNRAYAEREGQPAEVFIGQNHFALYPNPAVETIFRRVVETGEAYTALEQPFVYAARQGEAADSYWDWSLQPVKDASGQVLGLVFSLINVTFRKLAQDQLRRNAQQSQMLAEISKALAEAKLDIQTVVDTVAQQLGRLFDDLCLIRLLSEDGQRLKMAACHHPDPQMETRLVQYLGEPVVKLGEGIAGRAAATGQPVFIPVAVSDQDLVLFSDQYRAVLRPERPGLLAVPMRAQGRILGVLTLFRLGQKTPYTHDDLSTAQNLADRAALAIANAHLYQDLENALAQEHAIRAQLVQAEKLAGMGRMVASVAHELNNPLQTIKNCLYLAHTDLPPRSPVHPYLDMATSETRRLAELVAQLRQVYRPRATGTLQPLDLVPLLAGVPDYLSSQMENPQLEWQLLPSVPEALVLGIADQLKQVFINLTQNALEAMLPGGGRLTVEVNLSDDDRHFTVTFRDTGPGIPPENLDRLFEPFFTTKFTGLGLGLPICNDIVQGHGGKITVENQPGQGAAFTVWLPRSAPRA